MKTVGLLGGMSWESTAEYYRIMNEMVLEELGGLHSSRVIIYSFDFEELAENMRVEDWEAITQILTAGAKKLEVAGSDMILICTNTMHKVADEISGAISIPLLSIVDVTAGEIKKKGLKRVGLLGSKFTMQDAFYRDRLADKGVKALIPSPDDRILIHNIIFDELCRGIFKESSKNEILRVISYLIDEGAEGIILGCTELPLIVKKGDVNTELFDTTYLHAREAVRLSLK